jgi:hypothetical protein
MPPCHLQALNIQLGMHHLCHVKVLASVDAVWGQPVKPFVRPSPRCFVPLEQKEFQVPTPQDIITGLLFEGLFGVTARETASCYSYYCL